MTLFMDAPSNLYSTYGRFIFMQNLVVFRHGHTENDSRDILETMNPFFSLGTLATNVKQSVKKKGKD